MNGFISLLEKCRPVYKEDGPDLLMLCESFRLSGEHTYFWNASAGIDTTPLFLGPCFKGQLNFGREFYSSFRGQTIYLFSDYSSKVLDSMKDIYSDFDSCGFNLQDYIPYNGDGLRYDAYGQWEVSEMIPFNFLDDEELSSIDMKYKTYDFGMFKGRPVSDKEWQAAYMKLVYGGYPPFHIIYFFMDNLVLWKEIICRHNIPISIFSAFNVAGKSGSYDNTHSPDGMLWNAVNNSPPVLRPKYWCCDKNSFYNVWGAVYDYETESLRIPSGHPANSIQYIYKTGWHGEGGK